jgi:hypothetical protein
MLKQFTMAKVCDDCLDTGIINRRYVLHDGKICCNVCMKVVGEYSIDYDELSQEPRTRKHFRSKEIHSDNNSDEQ